MSDGDGGNAGADRRRLHDHPELGARDLSPLREMLPALRALVGRYFRADVRGLERVPGAPVLFVGNHSGGNGSPDSVVFMLAYLDRFGADRPLYWLGHSLVMRLPVVGDVLRRCGVVTGDPQVARAALSAGADVIVYPGGDLELHRPWTARNEVQLHGRTGFLRLARDAGVPLVPVVAHGGHNTYLPLTDGRAVARALRLDRLAGLKVLPVSLALPWGLNVGDFALHLPLPARITVEVLDPVDVSAYGDDLDRAYADLVSSMQATLDRLAGRTGEA